ncbi:ClpXP protease specificity-enhancing factor [Curvibacter sp. HBC61]|uniref:ClpXP protease specificity-enhancing factor n=1 Tax=Curvibacter cyanobacteriorum TaxID=3026422 RepID=A0ABT5MYT1_9BURK|nr:ClpXP protease specificity-enhancing factor [Curvibacter sp. HBC61]MDD0839217.1 ClpXP protease specificity-enhancing factor [Curvibacter sp. HBC61]
MNAQEASSTRPYLIRALYEWCTDNGFTPYVAVSVDDTVQVPREFVKDGEIVLNVSFDATSGLNIGNEFLEFKARFGGVPREISVPIERVIAIYARENGQGMAFPAPPPAAPQAPAEPPPAAVAVESASEDRVVQLVPTDAGGADLPEPPKPAPSGGGRPALKRVK